MSGWQSGAAPPHTTWHMPCVHVSDVMLGDVLMAIAITDEDTVLS